MKSFSLREFTWHRPHFLTRHHRYWSYLIAVLVWQVAVYALAGCAYLIGIGRKSLNVHVANKQFVSSLINPSDDDISESMRMVLDLRNSHIADFDHRMNHRKKHELQGATNDMRNHPSRSIRQRPNNKMDAYGISLNIDSAQIRALIAVDRGHYDLPLILILEQAYTSIKIQDESQARQYKLAAAIILVVHKKYVRAATLFEQSNWPYKQQCQILHESLLLLSEQPANFEVHMQMVDALKCYLSGKHARPSVPDLYWLLYDAANNQEDRAKVLLRLAPSYADWSFTKKMGPTRTLYRAAIQLLAKSECDVSLKAEGIAALANVEEGLDNTLLATTLHEAVVDTYPKASSWGMCVYNSGVLYRQLGFADHAENNLIRIFASSVNDRDRGAYLMTAYRNYRHRSAKEIARCSEDKLNYPQAYNWLFKATTQFTYQSWCGTCRSGSERKIQRELLVTSFKAGPVFLVFTLLTSPPANWYIWCTGYVLVLVYRRFRWRRKQNTS